MRRYVLWGLVLSLALAVSALAQGRAVWKIGEFDQSGDEFGAEPSGGPFLVARSRTNEWGRTQQAVPPGKAIAAAPRRIRFELRAAPQGTYTLRLGLIMRTPRLPVVQLDVNGHRGWFHQRFESDYREGNWEPSILPQYALGTLAAEIPAAFLRRGENEFALTAVTDPLASMLPGGEATADAVLAYDALELINTPAAQTVAGIDGAEATPTVYYKRDNGRLAEVVSVHVRWREFAPSGEVTLALPGWQRTQALSSDREFGDERLEFLVPEFAAGTRATIKVAANGRDYSFTQTLTPAKKWTVFLVPHEHLDVGYSDFQTKLAELHSRVIDEALALNEQYPEFRFSLDGYWQAQQFLEGRSEAEQQEVLRRRAR